jgi:hypothetical protein
MSNILLTSTNNSYEILLEEIIAKACLKGAKISSWYKSPNGRTVIELSGKLPTFYITMRAATDSLIHQYNLISQYRHLYQETTQQIKQVVIETTEQEHKVYVTTKAIYECDMIFANMDNELSTSTRRKLYNSLEKINASERMNHSEFYYFQNTLLEYFRSKAIEVRSTKKKKQLQMFIRFLEEISHSDIS